MLNCKHAVMLMSQGMDKKLGIFQRLNLRFHLIKCRGCRQYSKQIKFMRKGCKMLIQKSANIKD
jgi:hypothetical protein